MAGFAFCVFMVCLSAASKAADCSSYISTPFTHNILQSHTAYIERLFATFRARLAICTRRTRHPARHLATVQAHLYVVGCLYNFCRLHSSLRTRTPAMAAGLTDHRWSFPELFWWHPAPFWASTV
jgi:hypothetical protein